jgi:hypothetical protein
MARVSAAVAGLFALASGMAYLAYWPILARPDWAITAWNLLIVPTALYLGVRLAARGPMLAATCTAAGIAASLLWATGFQHAEREPWWIGLAAIWWLGIGWLLLPVHRATGFLTLALGVATAVDLVVTALDLGLPLLALGGLKLPLSTLWSFWIGVVVLLDAAGGARSRGFSVSSGDS